METKLKQAILLRTNKDYKSAESIFKELIHRDPKNPEYYYHYAWLNDNLGNEILVFQLYKKTINVNQGLKN